MLLVVQQRAPLHGLIDFYRACEARHRFKRLAVLYTADSSFFI